MLHKVKAWRVWKGRKGNQDYQDWTRIYRITGLHQDKREEWKDGGVEGWKKRKNSQTVYTANTLLDCLNSILWLESWII